MITGRTLAHQIGDLIRNARWDAELTQDAMAARAGVSRSMLARVENGSRTPTLRLLERLLAEAGKQLRLELDPLDADVRAAIADGRAGDAAPATVAVLQRLLAYPESAELDGVVHRFEGVAAASLLGAPVPVDAVDVALADDPRTWRWLTERLGRLMLRVTPTGWSTWMGVAGVPNPWELERMSDDDAGTRLERGAGLVREQILAECPDRRFTLTGPLDGPPARVRLVDGREDAVRAVVVSTELGALRAQPLDEIEAADGWTRRVLDVLREERPGCADP